MSPVSKRKKVLITVKTHPTLSRKYDELVCTAGILDGGSWVRVYPLPFRKLDYEKRYRKYQWLELELEKNPEDPRPESYRVPNIKTIKLLGKPIGTAQGWHQRREIIFANTLVFEDLGDLIERAKSNELSLAIFKPTQINDLIIKAVDREWDAKKIQLLDAKAKQMSLLQSKDELKRWFSVVQKLPYKFSYKFTDNRGRQSTLMIEDWEIGMLYWNCLKQAKSDENVAVAKVRDKYLNEFAGKDLYLFLGTTREFHGRAPNPFVIIGVFYPPKETQASLI